MSGVDRLQSWRTFQPDATDRPFGWAQWKGTAICMDLHCACGELTHLDAQLFAYVIRCGNCGRRYEMSGFIELLPLPDPRESFPSSEDDDKVTG